MVILMIHNINIHFLLLLLSFFFFYHGMLQKFLGNILCHNQEGSQKNHLNVLLCNRQNLFLLEEDEGKNYMLEALFFDEILFLLCFELRMILKGGKGVFENLGFPSFFKECLIFFFFFFFEIFFFYIFIYNILIYNYYYNFIFKYFFFLFDGIFF